MKTNLPSLAGVQSAGKSIYRFMQPTRQYCCPLLNERLGTELWVKHENQTPTGAFKARTAVVYVEESMKREPATRGLITATRGNHGQSVALAARRFGLSAIILVPHGNRREKNAAMRARGGTLVEFGADYQAAREKAREMAAEQQLHMVPPYHYDIVRGVASYWLELFSCVKDIDVAYVPIGMGSLLSGSRPQWFGFENKTGRRGFVSRTGLCGVFRKENGHRNARNHQGRRRHGLSQARIRGPGHPARKCRSHRARQRRRSGR